MKKLFVLFLVVALSVAMIGCGQKAPQDSGGGDKSLVIACESEIETSDVHMSYADGLVFELLNQSLVSFTLDHSEVVGDLTDGYTLENDGKDIVFIIPEGREYANGDPVTAESLKANFERCQLDGVYAGDLEPITEILVEGNKLILRCEKPAPMLWAVLECYFAGNENMAALEEMGKDEFAKKAVTYGPYKLDSWVPGQEVNLSVNETYKTFIPFVENKERFWADTIKIRFIQDAFTRISELKAGNLDIVYDIPYSYVAELKADPNIVMMEYMQAGIVYLNVNSKRGPLMDLDVRTAVMKALNKEEICAAQDNAIQPAKGYLTQAQLGYSPKGAEELSKLYAYDPDEAKALLEKAGYALNADGFYYKDGKKLTLEYLVALDEIDIKDAAPVMQAQLKSIGIDLVLKEMEYSALREQTKAGNYDLASRSYSWPDADMFTWIFHTMGGYYSDAKLDVLIDEARYITDEDAREAKYQEVQLEAYNQMAGIPMWYEVAYTATRSNIKGIKMSVGGTMHLNDLVKE